jgi:hypothetical protein
MRLTAPDRHDDESTCDECFAPEALGAPTSAATATTDPMRKGFSSSESSTMVVAPATFAMVRAGDSRVLRSAIILTSPFLRGALPVALVAKS